MCFYVTQGGDVLLAGTRDVSFEFNKYNEMDLLSEDETIANIIVNSLFLVPGNIPGMPTKGVDLRNKYMYKSEDEYSSETLKTALVNTCGDMIGGAIISDVDLSIQQTTEGESIFLLIVRIMKQDQDRLLGITMMEDTPKSEKIRFNFDYVDI